MKQTYGDDSLRYTLLVIPASLILAAVFMLVASRHTDRDAAGARSEGGGVSRAVAVH
jgi:hypothetical protein